MAEPNQEEQALQPSVPESTENGQDKTAPGSKSSLVVFVQRLTSTRNPNGALLAE
jgi:hypothetical protein